jgi:hypothetical protein
MARVRIVFLAAFLSVSAFSTAPARADEGMWTFDNLPLKRLASDHHFTPPPGWSDHLRASTVRLADSCSGSFISANGLVLSNHHCVRDCLDGLSTPTNPLTEAGYLAATAADEKRCPDFEADQLIGITHVSERIKSATAGRTGREFRQAEQAAIAAVEKGCTTGDEVRCNVVTLFHGGAYDLYKYRRYQDVRLVFAPEAAVAAFGDAASADWPLRALDMSLVRVYDHGHPLDTSANHLAFAAVPSKAGDLVFAVGNPAQTERLTTVAQLEWERDVHLPMIMADYAELHGMMAEATRENPELAREASDQVFGTALTVGRYTLQHRALTSTGLLAARAKAEAELRAKVAADPALAVRYGGAWDAIAVAVARERAIGERLSVLELRPQEAGLMLDASLLVREAAQRSRPDGERLPEFRDSGQPAMRALILSPAPVYPAIEMRTMAWVLSLLGVHLGTSDPATIELLGHESPHDLAARLIGGTRLGDVAVRRSLLDGGAAAIAASTDPLIVYMRDKWEPRALAVREDYENVQAVITANSALIDQARLAALGADADPYATFSPRISYGVVRGYSLGGVAMPVETTIGESFALDTGHDPFRLPRSWLDAKPALDMATSLNMVSTVDTVGGNSGSPLVDRDGHLVGLVYAINDAGEAGAFGYDDTEARTVAVTMPAIQAALVKIYHANRIVREIEGN